MRRMIVHRRQFMMVTGSALAIPVLTRCAPAREGKVLVTCIPTDPPTMNQAISSDIYCGQTSSPVYSWLLAIDRTGKHIPDLATSWDVSPDARVFTFHLRDGVLWHDGKPFTSADVKFTITEMLARLHPLAKRAYRNMQSIDTPDEKTVVITFAKANNSFLTLPQCFGPILPRHLWQNTDFTMNPQDKAPVGTGPYRLVEYSIGQSIRYKKNEHYHFRGQPHFDELIMSIIPDPVARSAAFENGDVDCIFSNDLPANDVPRLKAMPHVGAEVSSYPGGAWLGIINMRNKPFADKMVRHALAHAINRKYIRDKILPDGTQDMVGPLYPSSPLYNAGLKDYVFDPAKANALLDAAGYPRDEDGTRFKLNLVWNSAFTIVTPMATVIVQNLRDVGISVVVNPMEGQAVIQRLIKSDFDIVLQTYGLGPDPDFGTERLYNSENIKPAPGVNNSAYINKEVDSLFEEQRYAVSSIERKAIYDRIQEIIWDDIPIIPIFSYSSLGLFHEDRVRGIYWNWTPLAETFSQARPG